MATYVVSDLHGQYELFLKGIKEIDLKPDDKLYVIGDAIDRGNDGIRILSKIKNSHNMEFLIGNHEYMMLYSLDDDKRVCNPTMYGIWQNNACKGTIRALKDLSHKRYKSLFRWLLNCAVSKTIEVNNKKYTLTHTCFSPELDGTACGFITLHTLNCLVWNSPFRSPLDGTYCPLKYYERFEDRTFITGHVPVQRLSGNMDIFQISNVIDIDGGCAYLSDSEERNFVCGAIFLRLDDMKVFRVVPQLINDNNKQNTKAGEENE